MIARSCLLQPLRTTTTRSHAVSPASLSPFSSPSITACSHRRQVRRRQQFSAFHSSSRLCSAEPPPDHYATLDLAPSASPVEIKKAFYRLSKSHHPDLHPNDATASQRFVKISEAYATLGSPEKKARYDRDIFGSSQPPSGSSSGGAGGGGRGSYSSASSPAGGRPASGLSRRRTKFQGPPPSFYRSGGWGAQGAKREEAASGASHTYEARGEAQSGPSGPSGPAGTGPGGFASGFDNDVPHFDHRGHYQTHSTIERMRHKARRKREAPASEVDYNGGNSALFQFVLVSGMLSVIWGVTGMFLGAGKGGRKQKEEA